MTNLALAEPPAVRGRQRPPLSWVPPLAEDIGHWEGDGAFWVPAQGTTGADAIELAELAGITLDPWQAWYLCASLTERPDYRWQMLRCGLVVSRQNGKGLLILARELAGLFLVPDERVIIHSAHRFDTSLEHLRRIEDVIESCPDLDRQVVSIAHTHGAEGIITRDGSQIHFRTRSKAGGRGFTGDLVILDEAMEIPEAMHGSLMPTLSARPNPQIWYTGTAVNQKTMDNGVVLSRVRHQALRAAKDLKYAEKRAQRLLYAEYSADANAYEQDRRVADDIEQWARANPALGIRVTQDFVQAERDGMDEMEFITERLGIGDWPDPSGTDRVISAEDWREALAPDSVMLDPHCLAFDVNPSRTRGAIGAAGFDRDGNVKVEVIKAERGTGWIGPTLAELAGRNLPLAIACDGRASGSLLPELEEKHGLKQWRGKGSARGQIVVLNTSQVQKGCGLIYDQADQGTLRHGGQKELDTAVAGAVKRELEGAWTWNKRTATTDITPLVAVTLGDWGLHEFRPRPATVLVGSEVLEDEEGEEERSLAPLDPEDLE